MNGASSQNFHLILRPSSFSNQSIFDPKAYHSAFEKLSGAISIENLTHKPTQIIINQSLLPPHGHDYSLPHENNSKEKDDKKQILPHFKRGSKNIYALLRQKIQENPKKIKEKQAQSSQKQKQISSKGQRSIDHKEKKKNSISAYFYARKQLFNKQQTLNRSNQSVSYNQSSPVLTPIHKISQYSLHQSKQQIYDQFKYLKITNSNSLTKEGPKTNFLMRNCSTDIFKENSNQKYDENKDENLGQTQFQTKNIDQVAENSPQSSKDKQIRYDRIMDENKSQLEQLYLKSQEKIFAHRSMKGTNLQFKHEEFAKMPFLIPQHPKRQSTIKKKFQQSLLMVNNNNNKQSSKQPSKQSSNYTSKHSFVKSVEKIQYYANFQNQVSLDEEDLQFGEKYDKIAIHSHQVTATQKGIYDSSTTAKSYAILHVIEHQHTLIHSKNVNSRLQIASITKIMTCLLALLISRKFCIDIFKQRIVASERASKMTGTSARLTYADTCTLYELMHGLMLPSGNDAAIVIGQWGGKMIKRYSGLLKRQRGESELIKHEKSMNFLTTYVLKKKSNLKLFIHHMNKLAKHYHLTNTNFVNVHGLMNEKAYSTAVDVAKLSLIAMKNDVFRQIVNKKEFKCQIFNRTYSQTKQIYWINTNKLLELEGFQGVKTGVTPNAGPCLSSFFKMKQNQFIIIVVLKTKSMQKRFKETLKLVEETLRISQKLHPNNSSLYRKWLNKMVKSQRIELKVNDSEECNNIQQDESENQDGQNGNTSDQNLLNQSLIDQVRQLNIIENILIKR